jgi:hypothetical protein
MGITTLPAFSHRLAYESQIGKTIMQNIGKAGTK